MKLNSLRLTGYDFHPESIVIVIHQDGSLLIFHSAFALRWRDWHFIYTEHNGYTCYHEEDADVVSYHSVDTVRFDKFKRHPKSVSYLRGRHAARLIPAQREEK